MIATLVVACEAISHANDYGTASESINNCAAGTLPCGGSCVPEDALNCGSCGVACSAAQVCSGHACSAGCTDGTTLCNGKCVDTQTDNKNCGQCGGPEDAGVACTVCVQGQCAASCDDGFSQCGTTCVNTSNDPSNCGVCGKTCASNDVCGNGSCGGSCGSFTDCSGSCVDLKTDATNCGTCKNRCTKPAGLTGAAVCLTTTISGNVITSCHAACTVGLTTCGSPGTPADPQGAETCVNLATDVNNCGVCENVCPKVLGQTSATTCAGGVCGVR
ncbi:MAG: hypothetical protein ABI421_15080 [Polyangiaceae bacterium]